MKRYAFVLPVFLIACQRNAPELSFYGVVPEFQLTDQSGRTFDSNTLKGKIWVADFIFTNCPGVCPRMTSQMHQVQQAVSRMPDMRLVSFTVDPDRDTPPVLTAYAKLHHADTTRWSFLTGPQATLHDLCRNVFKLGNVDGSLAHSTRFVLIDQRCQIRGYYDTSEADSIPKLVAGVHALARERS
jgi:protein SCO1